MIFKKNRLKLKVKVKNTIKQNEKEIFQINYISIHFLDDPKPLKPIIEAISSAPSFCSCLSTSLNLLFLSLRFSLLYSLSFSSYKLEFIL